MTQPQPLSLPPPPCSLLPPSPPIPAPALAPAPAPAHVPKNQGSGCQPRTPIPPLSPPPVPALTPVPAPPLSLPSPPAPASPAPNHRHDSTRSTENSYSCNTASFRTSPRREAAPGRVITARSPRARAVSSMNTQSGLPHTNTSTHTLSANRKESSVPCPAPAVLYQGAYRQPQSHVHWE